MGSRAAGEVLARAECAINVRRERYAQPLVFGSVGGCLRWYVRERNAATSVRSVAPRTTRHHIGFDCKGRSRFEEARIAVDGSRGVGHDEVLAVLVTIGMELAKVRELEPGRFRALELTLIVGDPEGASKRRGRLLLTQAEAARRLNVSQGTISNWIGWCEIKLRGPLRAAGVM